MRDLFVSLEARRHFAATAVLSGTTLTITGTDAADSIYVNLAGGKIAVKLAAGQPVRSFDPAAVKLIVASLGAGNDAFTASSDLNVPMKIAGGGDDDSLRGGGGNDTLQGQAGTDQLLASWGNDVLSGGTGTDTADYSLYGTSVALSLDNKANDGAPGGRSNIINDVENLTGSGVADTLVGNSGANVLRGNGGNDLLIGATVATGPDGTPNTGADTLYGGNENDTLVAGASDSLLDGGEGDDSLSGDTSSYFPIDRLTLLGGGGRDTITALGEANVADGGAGDDRIDVGSDSTAYGRSGADTIYAVGTGDTLYAGSGRDTVYATGYTTVFARDGEIDTLSVPNDRTSVIDRDAFDVLV